MLVDEDDADVVPAGQGVERLLHNRDGRVRLDDQEVGALRRPVAHSRQHEPRHRVLVPNHADELACTLDGVWKMVGKRWIRYYADRFTDKGRVA